MAEPPPKKFKSNLSPIPSPSQDNNTQLSQYCASSLISNLEASVTVHDYDGYTDHTTRLNEDEEYHNQIRKEHDKLIGTVNDILTKYDDFQVNREKHNMHCMENVEELTIKLFFQKQTSRFQATTNEQNEGFWVVYDDSDLNSGFIGCDIDGKIGGKWTEKAFSRKSK